MVKTDSNDRSSAGVWAYRPMPEMDDQQFQQWQQLLEERTGMTLSPDRRAFLQTNLGIRMREVGSETYQDYFQRVTQGPTAIIEWATLVDRLTVQETRFFRDPDACRLVSDYVMAIPSEQLREDPLEVWSVGCSTGEETYTLAMVIQECMDQLGMTTYFGITGTDISVPALEKAKRGIYPARKLVTTDDHFREKYFVRKPAAPPQEAAGVQYEVVPALRDRICFSRVNVLELSRAPMHGMNIIFCQNLLIYFRRWRRKDIVNRLAERLAPGGLLILGQGEVTDWQHPHLKRVPSEKVLAWVRRQTESSDKQ